MCVDMPCGYSSQTLAKAIALADIVIGICTLTIFTVLWGNYPSFFSASAIQHYSDNYKCLLSQDGPYFLLLFLWLFYCLGTLVLALILLDGAQRRDHCTLLKWLVNSGFLWIVRLIIFLVWVFTAPPGEKVGPAFLSCVSCFYNGTTISMVHNLMKHILDEGVTLYSKKRRFD